MFERSVVDVITREGKRVFATAGEFTGSIAATAATKPKRISVPAHGSAAAELTLTIPMQPSIRAVVARFQGAPVAAQNGPAISLGIGSLVTFELSGNISAAAAPLVVHTPTSTRNLSFSDSVQNVGGEPFIATRVVSMLYSAQRPVTHNHIPPYPVLPGP